MQAGLAVCDAMVGPSAELVSSKPGLPFATRWLDHRQSWFLSKPGLPFATRWLDHRQS